MLRMNNYYPETFPDKRRLADLFVSLNILNEAHRAELEFL